MKSTAVFSAGLLAGAALAQQSGPACNGISYDFSSFGGTLNYKTVTKYNWNMPQCQMQDTTVKSPIAPLDQGLTAVFRGPLKLKQFAVYNEAPASKKRDAKSSPRERRHHNHERFHKKHAEPAQDDLEKRGCGDPVTAVIDGKPVTWANSYGCDAAAAATPAPAAASQAPAANSPAVSVHADVAVASSKASSAPAAASSSSAPSTGSSSSNSGSKGGAWNRVAYYSASSGTASNLTFLYPVPFQSTDFLPANGDTTGQPAGSPQTLGDVLIPDNSRFYINSGDKMTTTPNPNGKSYHGFSGNKIMLVEMTMPKSGSSQGQYPDQPAFWLLNEELPATSDGAECNCWASGCGEWDIHEVLTKGADIGYSTMHMGSQYCGGADNGFKRVTSGTQKLAVIIKAGSTGKDSVARVIQLDDSYNFSDGISESDYQKWVSTPTAGGEKGSVNAPCTAPKPGFKA